MVGSGTLRVVIGHSQLSESVIELRLSAKPVNITFVQVYARTGRSAPSVEEVTALCENILLTNIFM